ncbi:mechanosensitive ion channel family protein [Oscillatoria salina]|uniref:mechanosensitive ion channel family protein n=1 Tax=Oscillatoria salina TaxID=331517 RepID=UPI001CCBD971|nr:mechanosensitive ion channel family protein [Oscillatoria salina]MBZ8182367.1 mechanosensitive ion channel family protein [Oscillatoria salina IIICB1]
MTNITNFPDFLTLGLVFTSLNDFQTFLTDLGITIVVVVVLYILCFYVLRFWLRQLSTDLPLVTLNVSRFPVVAIALAVGIKISLGTLPSENQFPVLQKVLSAFIVVIGTYWFAKIITEVLIYFLKDYAEKSEAMWDDVVVPILATTLPVIIYLVGGLLALQSLGIDLTGLWVAFGGATFVLGFALKDILANFFSGLVLLIDTPFRFGDVISLPNGSIAVIKNIGLRVTNLYLIDTHSEMYIPNGALEGQQIVNLSRPTSHYYYTVSIPLQTDVDPTRAIKIMENVVLAHPDTLGDIDKKLEMLDRFYGFSGTGVREDQKRENGRQRLLAEKQVNLKLRKIEQEFELLSEKISHLEKGGLDFSEISTIRGDYLEICEQMGLEMHTERLWGKRKRSWLEEAQGNAIDDSLLGLIRHWYLAWEKDPDLMKEDRIILPKEWEQKMDLLKIKMNKLFKIMTEPSGQETRLDDYVENMRLWLSESFKSSRNEWQDPKVWADKDSVVKFYVDDIKLEHCERGNRIKSEVRREMIWHLRQAYLYK